jgi:hypothetical protein
LRHASQPRSPPHRGKEPPEFASDHPSDEHRIQWIEKWMPEAERAYKSAQPS